MIIYNIYIETTAPRNLYSNRYSNRWIRQVSIISTGKLKKTFQRRWVSILVMIALWPNYNLNLLFCRILNENLSSDETIQETCFKGWKIDGQIIRINWMEVMPSTWTRSSTIILPLMTPSQFCCISCSNRMKSYWLVVCTQNHWGSCPS